MDHPIEVVPATWTLRQIDQVERLWCKLEVDRYALLSAGEDVVFPSVANRLSLALAAKARALVVEVDQGDCSIEVAEQDDFKVTYGCRWRPTTKVVELVGGHRDGQMMEFERAPESLLVPVLSEPIWEREGNEWMPTMVATTLRYEVSGWSEQGRHWVYKVVA